MRKRHLASVILLVGLLCIPLTELANTKPKATPGLRQVACVSCGYNNGNCRTCVGGGTATYCTTFNCGLCGEDGECSQNLSSAKPSIQSVTTTKEKEPLTISSSVIRDIGLAHPRFAITLAEMNVYGISPGEQRLYWTPKTFSSSDVEMFLNKGAHSKYFRQYDREIRGINRLIQKGELSDIVYRISTKLTEDGSWWIRMQVESDLTSAASVGDPSYSTLVMHVGTIESVQGALGESRVTWQLR
jgi:hypothetical protein